MLSKLYFLRRKTKSTKICKYLIMIVKMPNSPKKANDIKNIVVVHPATGVLNMYTTAEYKATSTATAIMRTVIVTANR